MDKSQCCGCGACVQRCPKQCITMFEDEEGFLYPKVDRKKCIECGLCEKVCPVINQYDEHEPLAVYAAKNADDKVRMQSSSGGIFTLLAEQTIEQGGVVFGACFNERWEVVHCYLEEKESLAKFRGSKYVQSKTGDTYRQAEAFLKEGRKVLYSGTPCQIAGLKIFLRKDYDKLLAVDFICHGVPSPGVFRTYLQEQVSYAAARQSGKKNTVLLPSIPLISERDELNLHGMAIEAISFRDKRKGWKKYGFALILSKASAAGEENTFSLSYEPLNKNAFMRGFLRDLYLRPSCHACPAKQLKSGSDITLGDFWGIETLKPEIDDDRGVSAVTVNTSKGISVMKSLNARLYPLPYDELTKRNPALVRSVGMPRDREMFFKKDGKTFEEKIKKLARTKRSLRSIVYSLTNRFLPKKLRNKIKQIIKRYRNAT